MEPKKKKREDRDLMGLWLFPVLWGLANVVGFGGLWGYYELGLSPQNSVMDSPLSSVIPASVIGSSQLLLIRARLGYPIQGWVWTLILPWGVSSLMLWVGTLMPANAITILIGVMCLVVVPFIAQAWLLRKEIRFPWAWPLITIFSIIIVIFSIFFIDVSTTGEELLLLIALDLGAEGCVRGWFLVAVFRLGTKEEHLKKKVEA